MAFSGALMAYLTARINYANQDDISHGSCFTSIHVHRIRSYMQDLDMTERTGLKAISKKRFNTASLRGGTYDGPNDDYPEKHSADRKSLLGASTLPNLRSRASKFRRSSLTAFERSSYSKTTGTGKSPDRFLPKRPALGTASQSFRVNKDPQSLSNTEKLLRSSEASRDAFNSHRRVISPIPSTNSLPSRRNVTTHRTYGGASVLTFQRDSASATGDRHVSVGTVWTVGGLAPTNAGGVSDGRGRVFNTGTNAPLYTTSFSVTRPKVQEEIEKHESRLAQALDLDRITRVLEFRDPSTSLQHPEAASKGKEPIIDTKTIWKGTEWVTGGRASKTHAAPEVRTLPVAPFKVLDAPNLRDDFYCSVLAYSATCHTLAVGLGSLLYAWSEMAGVHLLNSGSLNGSWLTSLAFSSTEGQKCILAFGRSDGSLSLMSIYDSLMPRAEVQHQCPIACLAWKPGVTMRTSRNPVVPEMLVRTEDLLVGDEIGNVYYYAVEWPDAWSCTRDTWSGSMTLLAKLSIHQQQICGLSFSCDGNMFATGGNDNLCCIFRTNEVLQGTENNVRNAEEVVFDIGGTRRVHTMSGRDRYKHVNAGAEKQRWIHGAAVKAIAFCPWRSGLVATGGGSNDKCIHFFHTTSGACLATISVAAQVTSLIWSTTRREICATFGYAQPDHPYRIAVFSWPDCKQVAAIPWDGEHRALYAIPYPGGPNENQTSREDGRGLNRTAKEGCIVVASSDESVKFHEVWAANQKATAGGEGMLGGSDILEGLEGIDKEGEIIR